MNGSPITDCDGSFLDNGGASANYSNNQNLSSTICSNGTNGTHVRLTFGGLDIAAGDELCFFDGNNLTAPLLSCASDYAPGTPIVVQATAANPSGCLTVSFNSDAANVAAGWNSLISCVASCQTVLAELTSTAPSMSPADTGWIDVCPGQRIFFNGKGVYPQNDFAYHQSDFSTTFEWNFGDGGISYGPNVSHQFNNPGGYYVQMTLSDTLACKSINLINQRIRVAPRPNFGLGNTIDNTICAKDTISLSATVNNSGSSTLLVSPNTATFSTAGFRSDSLALPDGTGVPYKTNIYFTEFTPGQVLTNINDLEGICVNMEHSWLRDMEIKLTCPNGNEVVLHNFGGQMGSQVFLGQPNDNDVFNPVPGVGYDYCWTPTATNPSWLQYANNLLGVAGGTLPAGNYQSAESLNGLLGCPLNGEWTITVEDLWALDNGYIFNWGINFKNYLYPNIETFSPALTAWNWNNHPSIFAQTDNAISAAPQNAGTAGYVFTVHDAYGCNWDTLISVNVLPFTHPDCHKCTDNFNSLKDTAICLGNGVALNASFQGSSSQVVNFEAYPDYAFGNAIHPHQNPYISPIAVSSLGFSILTDALTQVEKVCMDIETDFDSDLNIYLQSPDGKKLELSTGNGGSGDNYKISCFTPAATNPVTGAIAPFNGNFKPEGNWTALNGAMLNGNWKLIVSDGFGPTKVGKVKWWSIGFKSPTQIAYTWQNANTLSCGYCPTPTANPSTSTNYIVNTVDNFQCTHTDTASVEVYTSIPNPGNLTVTSMQNGSMTYSWTPVPGVNGYVVNVNNSGWAPSNGNLSHTISGLSSGDMVDIEVHAIGGGPGCPPQISTASQTYVGCMFSITLGTITDVKCYGGSDGGVTVSATNGVSPIKYYPDNSTTPFNTANIQNYFTAGNHMVIAVDAVGCRDTVFFTITEPPVFSVSTTTVDAICNGDDSGSASAIATGSQFPPYTYMWQKCTGGSVFTGANINNLYAGCYNISVVDQNNCQIIGMATVGEPAGFLFSATQDSVTCYNGSDGSATISVSGGSAPYSYQWSNGSTTNTGTGLKAGFHPVTVTDNEGCEKTTLVQVLQPSKVTIDSVPSGGVPCFNGTTGTSTIYVRGGVAPYKYLWENGQTTITATGLTGGDIYTVTVTDAKGCTDASSTFVVEPPALVINFTNVSNETCSGLCNGTATITVSGGQSPYSYAWSNQPNNTATATGLCAGFFTVTVTDGKGCTNTKSMTIQPAPAISLQITGVSPRCFGDTDGSLTSTITGGISPFTYIWSNQSTNANLSNLSCGDYSLTITDNNGCTKNQNFQLVCPPQLTANEFNILPIKCNGEASGEITVNAQGGTGVLTYAWNDPNNQVNANANHLRAGNYIVTVTDENGCTATGSKALTEPDALLVTVTATDVACFGENTGQATASVTGGVTPYTYLWNTPQTTSTIINLSIGNYKVTITDANGCVNDLASAQVNQPASVVSLTVMQATKGCFGSNNNTIAASATGGNGSPYTFSWTGNLSGPNPNNVAPGIYGITVSDQNGCTDTASIDISEFEAITANIATTQPSCNGLSDGQAAVNNVGGGAGAGNPNAYIYNWSAPNSANTTFISDLPGGQQYYLTITDSRGCTQVFETYMGQPSPIGAVATIRNVSCNGLSDGNATITNVTGDFPADTYVWSNNVSSNSINNVSAGEYMVTITDTEGCTGISTLVIQEPAVLQIADFTINPLKCTDDNTAAASAIVEGGTPAYQYLWANGSTTESIINLGAGNYLLTVTDANGCTTNNSVEIVEPTALSITSNPQDVECYGLKNGRVKINVSGGTQPYAFSKDSTSFFASSTFFGLAAGDYTFYIKDGNGCIAKTQTTIGEPLQIDVNLGIDTSITLGDSLMIYPTVDNGQGLLTYNWRSGYVEKFACLDTFQCSSIQVKPVLTNTYTLVVTDENGCIGTGEIEVKVEKFRGTYVPTGFSPNQDLTNDKLCVYGKSRMIKEVLVFKIFDRWGEIVYSDANFSVNDETRGWDGSFRGKDCQSGEYAWYIEVEYIDGFKELLRGSTMLIR